MTTPPSASIPSSGPPDAPKPKSRSGTSQSARTTGADIPAAAAAAATTGGASSNPIQLSDLQNFLEGISTAPSDQQSGMIIFLFYICQLQHSF